MKRIPETYTDFLAHAVRNGERDIFLIGGRRSGKTISTYGFLDIMAQNMCLNITTLCNEYQPLQRTIADFNFATGLTPRNTTTGGLQAVTMNGSVWPFLHLDSKEKAQGTQCDILFVNEAVNVKQEVLDTVAPGVRLFTIYNLNPTRRGRLLDKSTPDNTLVTTWRDNPYLTPQQVDEFEAMKERAMRPNATKYDTYMYQVYYLGNFAQMVGQIFPPPSVCTVSDYEEIPAKECVGIDFGFALDGDPTAVVGCKIWNNRIYLRQYVYQRGITSSEELAHLLHANGMTPYTLIVADYGGLGASRIRDLVTADNGKWTGDIYRGFPVYNCIKTPVMAGVSEMLSMDGITVTDNSDFLRTEMEEYSFDDGGTPHGDDHAIDAGRYAFAYLRRMGV